ncbi:15588_t:CDS:2, partial [Acaulospora colombiana]
EKSAEELAKMAEIDMRCLSLCTAMLERVMSTFDENSTLDGILAELIIPAVKSKDPTMRERGMITLGLCCLIHRVEKASSNLKLKALQIVFDLLTMYERDFLMAPGNEEVSKKLCVGPNINSFQQNTLDQVTDFLLNVLGNADSDSIQATAALGLSKLMITGVLQQDRTLGNQQLRQCLSIALPIYAYSTSSNQQRLQRVIIPSIQILDEVYHELEGEQEMITPLQILGTL